MKPSQQFGLSVFLFVLMVCNPVLAEAATKTSRRYKTKVATHKVVKKTVYRKPYKRMTTPVRYTASEFCSCVQFARSNSNVSFGRIGYARNLQTNSNEPQVGGIVKLAESSSGHLAVITGIDESSGTIQISEANYTRCQPGTRTISKDSSAIVGYLVN